MVRFIIISSKEENIKGYKDIINKVMINYDLVYENYVFTNNDNKFKSYCAEKLSTNVFIIEDSNEINSLEFIEEIRNKYSLYTSFIVVIDKNNKLDYKSIKKEYAFLIDIVNDYEQELSFDINYAVEVLYNRNKILSVNYNGQLYRLPFSDILFIEKEINGKKCIIHCKRGIYKICKSLTDLSVLLDENFIKTHQSAIVNKTNIKNISFNENKIVFINNSECNLISRGNKKILKDLVTK